MTFLRFCPVVVLPSGLQAVLPEYLKARFVQAALSYIGCNEEGQFVCRDNDCWCQCTVDYPQCNCPEVDLRAMEASLLQIRLSWNTANQDFEESGQCFTSCAQLKPAILLLHHIVRGSNRQRKQRQTGLEHRGRSCPISVMTIHCYTLEQFLASCKHL